VRSDNTFNSEDVTNYPPKGNTIIAFGDSLVVGVGAVKEGGFVTLLSEELGITIENLGRGGDTTTGGLDRLDEVLARDPDIVLLLLGGNDFLDRVPKEVVFSNLNKIVTKLHESGVIVVLLGVRGGILGDGYEDDFSQLARKQKTAYVPNVLEGLIGSSEFMDDAIHPNDKGYEKIAERVLPILQALLKQ